MRKNHAFHRVLIVIFNCPFHFQCCFRVFNGKSAEFNRFVDLIFNSILTAEWLRFVAKSALVRLRGRGLRFFPRFCGVSDVILTRFARVLTLYFVPFELTKMNPKNRRRLPLRAVEVFEAAARLGGVSAAAQELGITPPAVSRHLRNLEERLGVSLFEHGARPARPTAAARELLPAISSALDQVDIACRDLAERRGGSLTVSTMASVAATWLVPRAARFQRDNPDVVVTVLSEDGLTDFHRDRVDAVLRYGNGDYTGVHVEKLGDEIATPLCTPAFLKRNPVKKIESLPKMALINDVYLLSGSRVEFDRAEWGGWLAAMGVSRAPENIVVTTTQADQALWMAVANEGLVLARALTAMDQVKSGTLTPPLSFSTRTGLSYYFVCPMSARNRPAVQRFSEWLRKEFAEHNKEAKKHFPPPRDFPEPDKARKA